MNIADQNEDAEILLRLGNGVLVRSDLDLSSLDFLPGEVRLSEFQLALAHLHFGHDVFFATPKLLIEGGGFKRCLASVEIVVIVKTEGFRLTVARGDAAAGSLTLPRERRHLHDTHRAGLGYEHPEATFEEIKKPFNIPKLRNKAIFVAIPSTSGTATEVTAFSVITDYSTNIKYPLADFEITPDIAILDTDIPLSMPKTLTAHTGMDALTHAIEAYVASARSDFSDPLALKAISDIYDSLIDSYYGDKDARGKMHIAQCLAGMAFSNALLGIAHSLAHKTGAMFDIPHGCCNAILLPSVIQYNAKVCADRYATIARMLGLTGNTDKQLTDALIDSIKELNKKLGIAQTYKENGVSEELFKQHIDEIAANAVLDPCTGSNPRKIDAEGMKKVLTCAYYGEPVTF